jgi:hypothetical protein
VQTDVKKQSILDDADAGGGVACGGKATGPPPACAPCPFGGIAVDRSWSSTSSKMNFTIDQTEDDDEGLWKSKSEKSWRWMEWWRLARAWMEDGGGDRSSMGI